MASAAQDTKPARERTAMRRFRCSRPVAIAMAQGVISKEATVFDYGCGLGGDVTYLKKRGVKASGWDPNHAPDAPKTPAEVVNLGYVLNVIEDPRERAQTLRAAYKLAEGVLVVSVRTDRSLENAEEYADGLLTGSGTFQKLYTQAEFLSYLREVLDKKPETVAPGIAFVFKDEVREASYLANRAFTRRLEYRTDLIEEFAKNRTAKSFVKLANELGRVPLPEEFPRYEKLLETFGSEARIARLTLRHIDQEAFEGSREQRRDDILTYFAMLRFQGLKPPAHSTLPASVQRDVKEIWSSYKTAQGEGDKFLFSLGNPDAVKKAAATSPVGKKLPMDIYVHRSAEDDLPALLRLLVFAAGLIVGDVGYDLVKVSLDGRAVSFLAYENFDEDPHPKLLRSVRVYLPKASYSLRSYADSSNRPILHRKETLVSPDYPLYERFRALSEAEEKAGLLTGTDIGFEGSWTALLDARGLKLVDHQLRPK